MTEKKRSRDYFCTHINRVGILGRVAKDAMTKGDFVIVPIVVPIWTKEGRQWAPFGLQFTGDKKEVASKATAGDLIRATAFIVDRRVNSDEGPRTIKQLQVDPFREVGLKSESADTDPLNPTYTGIEETFVLLAGRHFMSKKDKEDSGGETPKLREGDRGPFCYFKLKYEDPFQPEPPEGEYYKGQFFDLSANGKTAERMCEFCRDRAQLVVQGTLSRQQCRFEVKGQKPFEPRIQVMPGGVSFVNLDRGDFKPREQRSPVEHQDPDDTSGIDGLDDSLPF